MNSIATVLLIHTDRAGAHGGGTILGGDNPGEVAHSDTTGLRSDVPEGAQRWRKLPWRTVLVAAFGCVLIMQGYYSFATRPEPYPTVRMPSFAYTAASDGTFELVMTRADVLFEDGTVRPVEVSDLMSDFRYSTARPSYDFLFLKSDTSQAPPALRDWIRERVELLHPGVRAVRIDMCWQPTRLSVKDASIVSKDGCVLRTVKL